MSTEMLVVEDLNISYDRVHVARDVSFEINEGEVVSIIGPNGAGKTTVFNALSGLKEYSGTVEFNGTAISELEPTEIVSNGLVHCTQERDLFPYFTVKQNLLMGAHTRSEDDAVQEDLETVYSLFPRLEERVNQDAYTLSGGEQQMLAIGRSLMSDPELLLLDEPTLGLAPVIIKDLMDAIDDLKNRGITILLAEQNVTFSLEKSDRVYLLENGQITKSGTTNELKESDYIQDAYIGI